MSLLTVAPVVLAAAIGAAMFIKEQEGILQARAFDYAQHDRHHRPRIARALETIAGTPAAKNADMAGLYEIGKTEHGRIDIRWTLSADGASLSVQLAGARWRSAGGRVRKASARR